MNSSSSISFLERFDKEDEKFEYDAAVKDHLDSTKIPEIMRNDVVRLYLFFRFVRISCTVSIGAAIILVRDENISTVEKLARRVGKGSLRLEGLAGLDEDDCEKITELLSKNCPHFFHNSLIPSSTSSNAHSAAVAASGSSSSNSNPGSGGSSVGDTGVVRVRKSPLGSQQRTADATGAAAAGGGINTEQTSSSSSSLFSASQNSSSSGGSGSGGSAKQSPTETKKVSFKSTHSAPSKALASASSSSAKKDVISSSEPDLPILKMPNSHKCTIVHPRHKPNDFLVQGGSEG